MSIFYPNEEILHLLSPVFITSALKGAKILT